MARLTTGNAPLWEWQKTNKVTGHVVQSQQISKPMMPKGVVTQIHNFATYENEQLSMDMGNESDKV